MAITDNLRLNKSTYLVTTGGDWTDNDQANILILDLMYTYPLTYSADVLTYNSNILFYIP